MGQKWGQHFLRSQEVISQILDLAEVGPADCIFEVGPGPGALTLPLVARCQRYLGFEIDPKWAEHLTDQGVETVVNQDFMTVVLEDYLAAYQPWKMVANLPYYITTPILERLVLEARPYCRLAVLMMQKEVAERIVSPASKKAGSLTYFIQLYADARMGIEVPPQCFDPPPKVDSSVIRLDFKQDIPEASIRKAYHQIVRLAFRQRRKMLRKSCKSLLSDADFESAAIDAQRRPETLTVSEFLSLAKVLENRRRHGS